MNFFEQLPLEEKNLIPKQVIEQEEDILGGAPPSVIILLKKFTHSAFAARFRQAAEWGEDDLSQNLEKVA